MGYSWTTALLVASGLLWARASAADLAEGLLLYVPFDGQATPKFCRGKPDVTLGGAALGEGRVGGGVRIMGTASVTLLSLGNFHLPRGTVAFWHKPDWDPNEDFKGNRFILKAGGNFQIIWHAPKWILFFMTGAPHMGKGFRWDYRVASHQPRKWKPGEWRHFAITWDSATGEKSLYLDGKLASEGKTEWMRAKPSRIQATVSLGSPSAQGAYDEWVIWDRVLAAEEVASLAGRPEDAAQALSAKQPTATEATAPVRFELVPIQPPAATIVEPGEEMRVPTVATNLTGRALALDLRLSLVDALGKVCQRWTQRLELPAKGQGETMTFAAKTARLGSLKIRAEFDWQGETHRRDVGGFAVWPRAHCKPSPDSFFGHHVNSWSGGTYIRQAERLGLSWVRGHDMLQATWMSRVMPDPGEPKWMFADHVDTYRRARVSILGSFFAVPYWACDPPRPKPKRAGSYERGVKPRLEEFERYVRLTVTRYGRAIRAWEVWNEPSVSHFWGGTPEEYGALAKLACRVAKETDPTCRVFVGGFTGVFPREWYARVANGGGFELCDGISFHGYTKSPSDLRSKIDLMRSLAKKFGPKGEHTELWDSEWGVSDTTFYVDADMKGLPPRSMLPSPSYLEGATRVVRENAVKMGLGVSRSFLYLHNAVKGPIAYRGLSSMEITHAPRPKLMALVAMEHLTRGFKPVAFIEKARSPGLRALVLSRGSRESLGIIWLGSGDKAQLPGPWDDTTQLYDLFANPIPTDGSAIDISQVPVYVRAPVAAGVLSTRLREAG